MEDYPLFPELNEDGKNEAQKLIDDFKEQLRLAASDVLGTLYCDVAPHIESDSWTNYRNSMMDGFKNYGNRKIQGDHDFKQIRQAIFREFHDEIIQDLNQDLVEENKSLKDQIDRLHEQLQYRY